MSNMVVNTNVLSLNAHRSMKRVGSKQDRASAKLSSGERINTSADDASGLAISEKMRAQIRGLNQAERNVTDGMSLINTMDGGLSIIDDILQRQRELTIQGMNDTYTSSDRDKIQLEINQLVEEIDKTANDVQFNGIPLLKGVSVLSKVENTRGINSTEANRFSINVREGESFTLNIDELSYGIGGRITIESPNGMFGFMGDVLGLDDSYSDCSSYTYSGKSITINNVTAGGAGNWQIRVDNISSTEVINYTLTATLPFEAPFGDEVTTTITDNATDLYIQAGANDNEGLLVGRYDCKASSLGVGSLPIDTYSNAENSLTKIDNALERVNSNRANCGAQYNRLNSTLNNVQTSSINLSSSESKIRDTDMAKEMMELTKSNVLQSAAMNMLSQANQSTLNLLQILK